MEKLIEIVKGNTAKLQYICEGRAYYIIDTKEHSYQLEINTMDDEWKAVYVKPEYKATSLMRWIRKGMETDKHFIQLK